MFLCFLFQSSNKVNIEECYQRPLPMHVAQYWDSWTALILKTFVVHTITHPLQSSAISVAQPILNEQTKEASAWHKSMIAAPPYHQLMFQELHRFSDNSAWSRQLRWARSKPMPFLGWLNSSPSSADNRLDLICSNSSCLWFIQSPRMILVSCGHTIT